MMQMQVCCRFDEEQWYKLYLVWVYAAFSSIKSFVDNMVHTNVRLNVII